MVSTIKRRGWTAGAVAAAGSLAVAGTALAAGAIGFDGKPGTGPPPRKLHKLKMKKFEADSRPDNSIVRSVKGPTGKVKFSIALVKKTVPTTWSTWSNGYHSSVYNDSNGGPVTLTLPAGTKAFYFYIEPNAGTGKFTATSGGVSSGPRSVNSSAAAKYFGFYAKKATGSVKKITVTETGSTLGFAIGEFGIH